MANRKNNKKNVENKNKENAESKVRLSNSENVKNLRKREKLRIGMIVFSLLTMFLALLNLFDKISIIYAIITFIISIVLKNIRDKTVINRKDELEDVRKEIVKNKKKFKRN